MQQLTNHFKIRFTGKVGLPSFNSIFSPNKAFGNKHAQQTRKKLKKTKWPFHQFMMYKNSRNETNTGKTTVSAYPQSMTRADGMPRVMTDTA